MNTLSIRWSHPVVVVATCLWLGRIRWAPGTWGAAAGVGLAVLIAYAARVVGGSSANLAMAVEIGLVVLLNAVSVPICTRAAKLIDGGKDPGAINLDEAASMPLTLFVMPLGHRGWEVLLAAFLMFRLFDILKPFPCRQLERLAGGCGIMADDWGAAVWAGCCLALVARAGWLPA
jgi:phosphatidylglycerophosphatase A